MLTIDWDGTRLPVAVVTVPQAPSHHPRPPQLLGDLLTTLLAADGAHTDPSLVPAHPADTLPKVSMIYHIVLTKALALSAIVELKINEHCAAWGADVKVE